MPNTTKQHTRKLKMNVKQTIKEDIKYSTSTLNRCKARLEDLNKALVTAKKNKNTKTIKYLNENIKSNTLVSNSYEKDLVVLQAILAEQ